MLNLNTARYNPERISDTIAALELAKQRSDAALVSFSGGKDSLVVLDMACRTFSRVEAFFMYLVPGVRVVEDVIDESAARFGVTVHRIPHWIAFQALRTGHYCDPFEGMPDVALRDIYQRMIEATGVPQVLTGARGTEGVWRRREMKKTGSWSEVIYPIAGWSRMDVLSYLASRDIPLPPARGDEANGIGLSGPNVLWLYDNFREDYERVRAVFPYVEAIIRRRDWFGVGAQEQAGASA